VKLQSRLSLTLAWIMCGVYKDPFHAGLVAAPLAFWILIQQLNFALGSVDADEPSHLSPEEAKAHTEKSHRALQHMACYRRQKGRGT